jgi:hypothetical protein
MEGQENDSENAHSICPLRWKICAYKLPAAVLSVIDHYFPHYRVIILPLIHSRFDFRTIGQRFRAEQFFLPELRGMITKFRGILILCTYFLLQESACADYKNFDFGDVYVEAETK